MGKTLKMSAAALGLACAHALAQMPLSYDFDFVTIGDVNNPAYPGQAQFGMMAGRGSVAYEYRIARTQVTTAQWIEFVNTFSTLGGSWQYFARPTHWGAVLDASYAGPGWRWQLDTSDPNAAMRYVGGISWRTAAMYCNWLHNGKASAPWALENGAYDTATFGETYIGTTLTFTDQWTRNPDAKFWIPSLDEWIKAAHYDPNRYGAGQEGWWEYSYMSDVPPVPGPPGVGQTSGGYNGPPNFWTIPLRAYPDMMSPWGLWDTSGAAAEWTEEVWAPHLPVYRFLKGSAAGELQPGGMPPPGFGNEIEAIWVLGHSDPWIRGLHNGVRVASAVPSPGTGIIAALMGGVFAFSRRRKTSTTSANSRSTPTCTT